jgi:two-component system, NarL family, sensor histidine kinase UhpB
VGKRLLIVLMFLPCLFLHSQTLVSLKDQAKTAFNRGQYRESIKYLKEALLVIEKTNDKKQQPGIYNSMGGCYCQLGDFPKGMESYYNALRISEELGDKNEMASAYQYLGAIYSDLGEDSLSLKNYIEALRLNRETGNKFRYAQTNNSVASTYLKQHKYSDALRIYRESMKIYEEPGAPDWGFPWTIACIGKAYRLLGDSAAEEGNLKAAKIHFEESLQNHLISLKRYKQKEIMGGYAGQYFDIGTTNLKLNRISEAKKYLQTGLQLFLESGSKEMTAETYLYLSRIDSLEEDYKNALRHYKLSTLYRDSVFNSEQSKKVNLYKTQYEVGKKEEEIRLLAAENNLKTTVAEKQKQQKMFAYAAIIFVVLVGSYAFYRYRIRKKEEVEQALLKDRLHISQGLHDDIGSTLSSISVYAQVAQKLSEKNNRKELPGMLEKIKMTSSEMISEMNDIVWTIHPKNDSMERIILRMESYARPLLNSRNIEFKMEYDPVVLTTHLEMEYRKNFYLVFKEAVNNAFKYSGCSEIITRILHSKTGMEMQIKDNGVGFNVQQEITGNKLTLSGNGLRNMKMRAEEMKGNLQINSIVRKGTEVTLSIPIP